MPGKLRFHLSQAGIFAPNLPIITASSCKLNARKLPPFKKPKKLVRYYI